MSSLILTVEHRRAIAKQGEALYPQECRGLLLGHQNGLNKQVEQLVFLDQEVTESEPQGYRYHIPSQAVQDGEEIAKASNMEIIGSFHSHVDEPARPSIYDRERAQHSFTYVIVGVRQGRAHELAAWRLSEDGNAFFQEDIRTS
jgi:proteasome lid subunit RPN8/RPN11